MVQLIDTGNGNGDGISHPVGGFKFDSTVAPVFEKHIAKSVPFYGNIQEMVACLSDWFIRPGSRIYDLGCSTGRTLRLVDERHSHKSLELIGVDMSEPMIEQCKGWSDERGPRGNSLEFMQADFMDVEFQPCDVVYSLYTLQFLTVSDRVKLCKRVADSMGDHGAFIVVEKVLETSPYASEIFQALHWQQKGEAGYTAAEIIAKSRAVRGVMQPLVMEEDLNLLQTSGFRTVTTFFKWLNFVGFLAIK